MPLEGVAAILALMIRDVFICHSASDAAVAEKVCRFLEDEKISCWMTSRDSVLGEVGGEMISAAIESCPIMLLILSHSANDSPEIQGQVERALQNEKILIPLRIENVTPTGRMDDALRHRFRHDAFVGPLDRHLPEVVRMLKPLLHRLVVRMREATSISRTLPSRSSIVLGGGEKKTGSLPLNQKIEISFHFPHPVFANQPSTVEIAIRGRSENLSKAELSLEGLGLKRRVMLDLGKTLSSSGLRHRLAFEPARSGTFPLHATVILDDADERIRFSGVRSLRINAARAMNDLVRPEDIVVNHDKAEVCLDLPIKPGEALPVSEVLAVNLPENFEPMELALDFQVGRTALASLAPAESLKIPSEFEGRGQGGTLLLLEPESASTDMPFQGLRLVARHSFNVGRSREESDFLAWFWPRNEVHDTKTRRISKRHCLFIREGAVLAIRNIASGSITTFDDQDLAGAETLILDGVGILNLSGIYQLEVARFPTTLGDAGPAPHEESARGSVGFEAKTSNSLPQLAIWLLSDASFGTNRANPLRLDLPGLAEIQGRFHYDQGMFWIESVADNSAVQVDAVALRRGEVVPLAQGMKVRLGSQSFAVGVET